MQTPMIHRNDGNMKSAGCMPFHGACSSHSYLPAPLFANIIVTMANPRNVSRLHNRDDVRRARVTSLSFLQRSSSSKWSVDAVVAAFDWNRFRQIIFVALITPSSTAPMTHTNSNTIQLKRISFSLFLIHKISQREVFILHIFTLTGDLATVKSQPSLLIVKL